ncbi:MAG TPA: glycine cleavage system protein GcvH [Pseudomonadota bacterium]|jgi:glycine cleavage system H protein|nr:glycine cleavage system protein GcvH [Pseudomonadota bacterium]HNF97737.1 glycine cleavage system protein GcvH [Pseudomonadota bacterium]HNI60220.1 glycine cleavage system protein GcvH [Pseudomonadota bacterium]HNK45932.1 glycine cleavage system protein GcvH [Pseudomonadota bacterium]HNN53012.1 glycine cleavage system protein GcvH [Pseudomonadota bacterium]
MSKFPTDLRYTKDHEWARIDGKRAVVGITDFAVHQLGDITQVDLPKEGESFRREQVIGTIESVKAVSDIYSPLSGKVVKSNDPLRDQPELLNEDCYDEGWMVELELSSLDELSQLMTSEEYAKYVKDHS